MQAYLLVGRASVGCGGSIRPGANRSILIHPRRRRWSTVLASAANNGENNHYAVLGVSPSASSADIKKAYRHLALKYHPDVSKDSRADEMFKDVRIAYDILSNQTSRNQYDRALRFQEDTSKRSRGNWDSNHEVEDELKIYRWSDLRQKMQHQKYWEKYNAREENFSFDEEADEVSEEETAHEESSHFVEVLRSVFLSLFLMQTIGARLSLTFSSLMALIDRKLDAGYKLGFRQNQQQSSHASSCSLVDWLKYCKILPNTTRLKHNVPALQDSRKVLVGRHLPTRSFQLGNVFSCATSIRIAAHIVGLVRLCFWSRLFVVLAWSDLFRAFAFLFSLGRFV